MFKSLMFKSLSHVRKHNLFLSLKPIDSYYNLSSSILKRHLINT